MSANIAGVVGVDTCADAYEGSDDVDAWIRIDLDDETRSLNSLRHTK